MPGNSQFDEQRHAMVAQLAERGIASPRVLAAIARVPREKFVPEDVEQVAYADRAAPIGCGQTISQPYIVALMTEALQLTGSETVLEVGTGSGYQTAILAELAGNVISIERHAELSALARKALDELGYRNIKLVVGDGSLGWPEGALYDAILVAAAARRVPRALTDQLAEAGRLVIPIGESEGQTLTVLHKVAGQLHAEWLSACRFVPLVSGDDE